MILFDLEIRMNILLTAQELEYKNGYGVFTSITENKYFPFSLKSIVDKRRITTSNI